MSSLNSNNENEFLDDPFASSGITSIGNEQPNEQESSQVQSEFESDQPDDLAPSNGEAQPEVEEQPFVDFAPVDADSKAENEEAQEIKYKKPRFDVYAMLLFLSWCALLTGIALFWFECDPTEYGDPPYKEGSVPVVRSNG